MLQIEISVISTNISMATNKVVWGKNIGTKFRVALDPLNISRGLTLAKKGQYLVDTQREKVKSELGVLYLHAKMFPFINLDDQKQTEDVLAVALFLIMNMGFI